MHTVYPIETMENLHLRSVKDPRMQELFPESLSLILVELAKKFELRRGQLLAMRKIRQQSYDQGKLPEYLDKDSPMVRNEWQIASIPHDLKRRRVEITGPVNSAKMVINMLARNAKGDRADAAMLDFEDSMCPTWKNVVDGLYNVKAVAEENLFYNKLDDQGNLIKKYELNYQDTAKMFIRVRGLHLNEPNFSVLGQPISAGLFDLVCCCYHICHNLVERGETPAFYIPKTEDHQEAKWWNDLLFAIEEILELAPGTIKVTLLIETLPAAFQVEEILYQLKDHIVALNVGRWDKIFSDIKVLKSHKNRVMADRASINMQRPWMDNYAKRLIKICHERGAMAIGGMSAFTPGKEAEKRKIQTEKVFQDKQYEYSIGHDGCWVSHPYFIGVAQEAFPIEENQIYRKLSNVNRYPDLIPQSEGAKTLNGLRTNVRVTIAYLKGWFSGVGCVSWDDLMEDLATLEISRAQVWQWRTHGVVLDSGVPVTSDLIELICNQELEQILKEVPEEEVAAYKKAKDVAEQLFLSPKLADYLNEALAQTGESYV